MGKIKTKSLKSSMTATFLITICVIAVLSAITILASNHLQQEILKKRYLMINSPNFQIDEGTGNYVLDVDSDNITWQPLSTRDNIDLQSKDIFNQTGAFKIFSRHHYGFDSCFAVKS